MLSDYEEGLIKQGSSEIGRLCNLSRLYED